MLPQSESPQPPLPPLREDLQLLRGQSEWTGAPSFLIHDPLRNRYFRVGAKAFAMLSAWRPVSVAKAVQTIRQTSGMVVSEQEVEAFAKFLLTNLLTNNRQPENWRSLLEQSKASNKPLWQRVFHNYIFFRIPLFRPQRMLDLFWPALAPLFTRSFAGLMTVLAVLALYLVSRQWDVFSATFFSFLSVDGLMIYGASLVFIKMIHEMGHAFMATKYRVKVPVVGIAFILLMPILYTDTTGAHRLKSRLQKLNIDLAGIYSELSLAVLATLAWVFLPDGLMRSVAFSTATLSWVLSLAVNLNPFMRFDGYYVLSDAIGFENLQERGFALAKWRMREILFDLKKPAPEFLPPKWRTGIILHAWGTWIYRFFLFLGIALLVYHFFFKMAGIVLFILEICWFIILPIWQELKVWWENRGEIIMQTRSKITLGIFLLAIGLFVAPLDSRVDLPTAAKISQSAAIHSLDSAMIVETQLENDKQVAKGGVLLRLASPDLEVSAEKNLAETDIVKLRLARVSADREDQSLRLVLEQELAAKQNAQSGLDRLADQLVIRAPQDGILFDVDADLHPGLWINPSQRLALLTPSTPLQLNAMVPESAVERITTNAIGVFIPDDPRLEKMSVRVEKIGRAALPVLSDPLFADLYGGRVPVLPANNEQVGLLPQGSWYPVHLTVDGRHPPGYRDSVLRGVVHVEGQRRSMAERVYKQIAGVLLRESGF